MLFIVFFVDNGLKFRKTGAIFMILLYKDVEHSVLVHFMSGIEKLLN